jgi:tRNA threonylcarbamoyladenosine biosynthesis protein TsaE
VSIYLKDENATIGLAERLRHALPTSFAGWTLLLEGELGAGKSTFARALIRAMGHAGPVPSPTYTLVEPYRLPSGTIYHVDLYRVSSEDELRYLGWNELDDGMRLVEWPDRAPGLIESADIRLTLAYDEEARSAEFDALSEKGQQLLLNLNHPSI